MALVFVTDGATTGIDVLAAFGRSTIFLFHALLGRGGIGRYSYGEKFNGK